jgi:hypothetical protein
MPLPDDMVIDTLPRVEKPVSEHWVSEPGSEQRASASAAMSNDSSVNVTPSARLEAVLDQPRSQAVAGTSEHEGRMEPGRTVTKIDTQTESADVLLDLGDIEPARAAAQADDFVLDLDDAPVDEAPAYAAAAPAYESSSAYESSAAYESPSAYESTPMRAFVEPQLTETQEVPYTTAEIEPYESSRVPPELTPDPVPVFGETEFPIADTPQRATSISADQLSPEMIDAIARRCVELMSDKVVREIAWEVVPDLAELLIKRQLEERQAK